MERACTSVLCCYIDYCPINADTAALRESYIVLTSALEAAEIPYHPAGASMFLWVDMRKALPPYPTWEDERALFDRMCEKGVLLTPGYDCIASEPGFFRACWAASDPEGHETV